MLTWINRLVVPRKVWGFKMKSRINETLDKPQDKRLNPYKGLESYGETDNEVFYGREAEKDELFKLVKLNYLTVVLGKAGIGKTSLLNAGVFPRLRREGYLPVRVRLNYMENAPSLLDQIRKAIKDSKIKVKIHESNKPVDPFIEAEDQSLWEYFQRVKHLDPVKKQIVKPVLVFDQFEEFFTMGKNHMERDKLIDEIHRLIENQVTEVLKNQAKEPGKKGDMEDKSSFLTGRADFRIILSLREDYLPDILDLKSRLTSKDLKMFRVMPLSGQQAREIIGMPGGFKEQKTINNILRSFYPDEAEKDEEILDEKLEVEPALLSLICYETFEERETVESFSREDRDKILANFYDSVMEECPKRVDVQEFVENNLLTKGGRFRTHYPLEPDHPLKESILHLIEKRILRKDYLGDKEHIEIIHDVLAPIIAEKRDKRLAEKERKELWKKKVRGVVSILAALLILITLYAIYQTIIAVKQTRNAQVNRLAAEALLELPKDNTRAVRIVEESLKRGLPHPPARTFQVLSEIGYSSYGKPFYRSTLHHGNFIYSAVFSPDGQKILTACEDGTAKLWNLDGKPLNGKIKHEARIMSAMFSPDGQKILTASWDKTAKLWALEGRFLKEFKHNGPVTSGAFSSDGRLILTASRDGTAKLWNLEGEPLADFKHDSAVSSAVFSAYGSQILTASWDKTAKLWDLAGKLMTVLRHDGAVESAMFSPDGKHILTASWDKTAKLWDLAGKQLTVLRHDGAVESAVFSNDGTRILTASRDKSAKMWDLQGNPLVILEHAEAVSSAVFSEDGQWILTASKDGTTKLWNLEGKLWASLIKHGGEISTASFSPDGSQIITTSFDGTARVWELKSNLLVDLKHKEAVTSVSFSPDGRRILTASRDHTARVWDIKGNLLSDLNQHTGVVYSAVFSPDGSRIITASNDGTAKLWDSQGNFLLNLQHNGPVSSAVFSPKKGDNILTASLDQSAKLWDLQGNLINRFATPDIALSSASFSPNGNWILTASVGSTVKIWNKQGKELAELEHNGAVSSAVFSPVSLKILTASNDGTAKVWDIQGKLLANLDKHKGVVSSAVFSPDGRLILTASYDGTSRVWDLEGKPRVELKHDRAVLSAVFSADGRRIVTASEDGTARLWNLSGELHATLNKHKGVVISAVFSPDGRRILTASEDGTAKVWFTPEAIFEWLKKAKIQHLSDEDRKKLGI